MPVSAQSQLHDIHSMMNKGLRSVRLEPHTLLLWGLASASLIVVFEWIIRPDWFAEPVHGHLFESISISMVLLLTGWLDFRLTRAARHRRDESISFVQKQVTKVWWLMVGLIVLINVGMNFFGGGFLFYPLVLVILGLALYVQGLFSANMNAWAGVTLMTLGLIALALQIPPVQARWLALCVVGLAFPILAFCQRKDFFHSANHWRRAQFTVLFALAIIIPYVAIQASYNMINQRPGDALSLAEYARLSDSAITQLQSLRLPSGTPVPLRIEIDSNVFAQQPLVIERMLALDKDLDIVVKEEKPTGVYRFADNEWQVYAQNFRMRVIDWKTSVTRGAGPSIDIKLHMATQ